MDFFENHSRTISLRIPPGILKYLNLRRKENNVAVMSLLKKWGESCIRENIITKVTGIFIKG